MSYSAADRLLHHIALGLPALQKSLAEIEDSVFARALDAEPVAAPVFLTGLPRSGTTVLLELLAQQPAFVTHTYRQMPFVMAPLLWERLAGNLRKADERRERAHGDGVEVGFDSPEAFEEILWQAFFPDHYKSDRIVLWRATDSAAGFTDFFRAHMRKLRHLGGGGRYLSKNNANIARLPLLARLFADAVFVIPFRNPADHIGSLMAQHRHFTKIHKSDPFALQYMKWLGHYEFGAALKPIAFGGPAAGPPEGEGQADFWLRYWIAAYRHVLDTAPEGAVIIDYDRLCREPEAVLGTLADRLGLAPAALKDWATRFRPGRVYDRGAAGAALWAEADALHATLRDRAAA